LAGLLELDELPAASFGVLLLLLLLLPPAPLLLLRKLSTANVTQHFNQMT
jgi:hypothetical protein